MKAVKALEALFMHVLTEAQKLSDMGAHGCMEVTRPDTFTITCLEEMEMKDDPKLTRQKFLCTSLAYECLVEACSAYGIIGVSDIDVLEWEEYFGVMYMAIGLAYSIEQPAHGCPIH